jgi:hypothetical protein
VAAQLDRMAQGAAAKVTERLTSPRAKRTTGVASVATGDLRHHPRTLGRVEADSVGLTFELGVGAQHAPHHEHEEENPQREGDDDYDGHGQAEFSRIAN